MLPVAEHKIYIVTFGASDLPRLRRKINYNFDPTNASLTHVTNLRVALLPSLKEGEERQMLAENSPHLIPRQDAANLRRRVETVANFAMLGVNRAGQTVETLVEDEKVIIHPGRNGLSIGISVRRDSGVIDAQKIPLALTSLTGTREHITISGNVIGLGHFEQDQTTFIVTHAVCIRAGTIPEDLQVQQTAPTGVA